MVYMSQCIECNNKTLDNRLVCKKHICKYCWNRPILIQKSEPKSKTLERVAAGFIGTPVYKSDRCLKCQSR